MDPQEIEPELYEYDPPSMGDTGLHAPFNPNSGKWYGLSHITVCPDDVPPPVRCEFDPELDAEDPGCVPPPEPCEYNDAMTADDPGCIAPPEPCEYNDAMTADDPGCIPPPDPVCVESKLEKIKAFKAGATLDLSGGGFTVTGVTHDEEGELIAFSWSSDVTVEWIRVKGGNASETYPGGTSGDGLQAPVNDSGKPAGISHVVVCAYPADEN